MKLSKKYRKWIYLLLVVWVVNILLIIFLLPPFVFNEFEWRKRAHLYVAINTMADTNYLIDIRRGVTDRALPEQKKSETPQAILTGIEFTQFNVKEAQRFQRYQKAIPLLPKTYRNYHQQLQPALDDYSQELSIFKELKTKEFRAAGLTEQLQEIIDIFYYRLPENLDYLNTLPDVATIAASIASQAAQLHEQGLFDDGMLAYYQFETSRLSDLASLITHWQDYSPVDFKTNFSSLVAKKYGQDFTDVVSVWHDTVLGDLDRQHLELHDRSTIAFNSVHQYYADNHLASDPLSHILSKVSSFYPRNLAE